MNPLHTGEVEFQLKQSRENFDFALQSGGMGTWDIDLLTNRVSCSKEMLDIWGLAPEEFDGNRAILQRRVHPEDLEKMASAIDAAIRGRGIYEFSFRILPTPGNERWVFSRGRCLYDDQSSEPIRFAGVVYDITKSKLVEKELRESKILAEQASLAKSQFLANVSHELRTPIGVISGFIELLKQGGLSDHDRIEFLSIIERNSQNLLRLIDDVLDLSKVEAGRITIERSTIELKSFLRSFKKVMNLKAVEKGINLEIQISDSVPDLITTDPLRLRQILSNIVGNAIKFTEHGFVRLTVDYAAPKLRIEITDTGPGIAPENINKLFRTFGQVDPALAKRHGGSGLGLVLSRHLAEALGGGVELVMSEAGRGSVFAVTIDVAEILPLSPSEPENVTKKSKVRLEGLSVLLVEDTFDNRKLIEIYLNETGAKVEFAVDGFEGVRKAIALQPDIVLMDIRMPGMDGHEATRQLREIGFSKPIIALTAHAMRDERDRCFQSGCTGFLTKPIDRDKLIEILSRYC